MLTCCWFLGALYAKISDMIPGVNIIGGKVSIASANRAGGLEYSETQRGFRGRSSLRKILGSKEHLDGLKIDLNEAETITVQDYK